MDSMDPLGTQNVSKSTKDNQLETESVSKTIKLEPGEIKMEPGEIKMEPVDEFEVIESGESLHTPATEPIESVEFVDIKEETNVSSTRYTIDIQKQYVRQSNPMAMTDDMDKYRRYTIEEDQAIYVLSNFLYNKYGKGNKNIGKIISDHLEERDENNIQNRLAHVISKNNFLYAKPTLLFEIELVHKKENEAKGFAKMITILTQSHMIVLKCKTPHGSSCIYNHPDVCIKLQYDSTTDFGIHESLLFDFLQTKVPKDLKMPTNLTHFKSFMMKSGVSFHGSIINTPSSHTPEELACTSDIKLENTETEIEPSFVFLRDKQNEDLDSQIRKIESKLQKQRTPDEKYALKMLKVKKRSMRQKYETPESRLQKLGLKAPIEFVERKLETNDSRPYNIKEDQAIFALINFLNIKYKLNELDFFTLIKEANVVDKRTVQIISDHIVGRDVGSIQNRLVNVLYKNRFIYTKPTFLFEIVLENESKHVSKMITILTQTHMIVLKCKTPNGPSCIGNHPDISITMEYDSKANFGIDEGLLYEFLLKNANVKVPTNLEMFKSFMTKNGISFHANSTWHIQNPFFIASTKKVSQPEPDLNLEKVTSEESYSDLDFRIGQIESILQNLRTPEEKHELKMLKARKRKRGYRRNKYDENLAEKKVDDFLVQSSKNKQEREQQLAKLKDGTEKQKLDLKTATCKTKRWD